MISTKLTCKSTSCIHNKSCDCMAGVITIKGKDATKTSQTTCNTYVEEGGHLYDNLANLHDDKKTTPQTITCTANTCKYNEDGRCQSFDVNILAANSSCDTFEPL